MKKVIFFLCVMLSAWRLMALQSFNGLDFQTWRTENFQSTEVNENGFSGVSAHWPFLYTPDGFSLNADENQQLELLLESQESYFVI